jgi:hypothetical protein
MGAHISRRVLTVSYVHLNEHMHARTHPPTRTHARTHTHPPTHTQAHPPTHTHARTHAHSCACRLWNSCCKADRVWEPICRSHWATKATRYHLTRERRRELLSSGKRWRELYIEHERDGRRNAFNGPSELSELTFDFRFRAAYVHLSRTTDVSQGPTSRHTAGHATPGQVRALYWPHVATAEHCH